MVLKSTLPQATDFILVVDKARRAFADYAIGRISKKEYDEFMALAMEARTELNGMASC